MGDEPPLSGVSGSHAYARGFAEAAAATGFAVEYLIVDPYHLSPLAWRARGRLPGVTVRGLSWGLPVWWKVAFAAVAAAGPHAGRLPPPVQRACRRLRELAEGRAAPGLAASVPAFPSRLSPAAAGFSRDGPGGSGRTPWS